ncbi:proteoglycan 4b isoform X2 [Sphaeramia orbicularis]|nr:proteoglycan 4-like isoform X2 [Sphaeramia orbicularis]
MSASGLVAAVLLAGALTFSAAQTSCKDRCGTEYYRGYMCQCDYSCLGYGECCKDYESQCTIKNSCKGRCGEPFKRGRLCSCDSDCLKYKQCCPDHKMHCDQEEISGADSVAAPVKTSTCEKVDDNKAKDSTFYEATEQPIGSPSTFSEGNNPDDDFFPLIDPTSYPQDDVSDGKYNQNFPNDDSSNPDPGSSPVPESTSGYESSPPDPLDPVSTEPPPPDVDSGFHSTADTLTGLPPTETSPSDPDPTQTHTSPPTLHTTSVPTETTAPGTEDPDRLSDATVTGTTTPQTSTDPDPVSTQFTSTSEPPTEVGPTADTPDLQTTQDTEALPDHTFTETPTTDPTATASDDPDPEATSHPETEPRPTMTPYPTVAEESTEPTSDSSTAPDHTEGSTQGSSTPEWTPVPDQTTSVQQESTDPESTSTSDTLSDLDTSTTQIPSLTDAAQDTTEDLKPGEPTADPLQTTPGPTRPQLTSKPTDKPLPDKPTSKPETKPAETGNLDNSRDYQGDDSNDTNLCSGRPVSAVTTLRNGTVVVFRGHFFWFLDRNRVPGPARGITEAWGVPSPIDTVFTRCNCQGKTYIFKGPRYWRFENDALDPGYPKVVETGFDGLRGHITAALSVPQHKRRRESVYFFKRGGTVQKYSYQFGTNPSCGRRLNYAIYTVRNRFVRQAVSHLEPSINIRTSWKGFPTSITAAVSIPNSREPEGYSYYVFSRSKSYRVRVDGERPVIATPQADTSPQTDNFFRCPKKV